MSVIYGTTLPPIRPVTVPVTVRIAGVLNKGLPAVKVTETVETLKQEVYPDNNYEYLYYIEGIHFVANNPLTSLVTLYYKITALLDDGTETILTYGSLLTGESFDDWLRWIYDAVPNQRQIKSIRLYAYCSGIPARNSEPTVQLERVTGLQI